MKRLVTLPAVVLLALCLLGVSSAASLRPAGSLDRSFGTNGILSNSPGGSAAGVDAVAVQPDGKIVVLGTGLGTRLIARYSPDGSTDPSFGNGGYAQVPAGYFADALAVQPDGKIVVGGSYAQSAGDPGGFMLARYNADGSLDTSFGTNGVTTTVTVVPPAGDSAASGAWAVAILPSGEIVAAGPADSIHDLNDTAGDYVVSRAFAVARYTSGGSLDSTFGDSGLEETSLTGGDSFRGMVVLPSGKVVVAGDYCDCGHGYYVSGLSVAGFLPDGSLDAPYESIDMGHDLSGEYRGGLPVLQKGRIVVVGSTTVRLRPDGTFDRSFGKRGREKLHLSGLVTSAIAQPDGKILISSRNSLVRLMPNGRIDKGFGRKGVVKLPSYVWSLALQADQKIIVGAGTTITRLLGVPGP